MAGLRERDYLPQITLPESSVARVIDPKRRIERIKNIEWVAELRAGQTVNEPDAIRHQDVAGLMGAILGEKYNYPDREIDSLSLALVLHDVEKPLEKGVLTPEQKMEKFWPHPLLAAKAVAKHNARAAYIILAHHEYQVDAYGHMCPSRGDDPSRLAATIDKVEALKSNRIQYNKRGFTDEEVLKDLNLRMFSREQWVVDALTAWNTLHMPRLDRRGAIYEIPQREAVAFSSFSR